MASDQSKKFWVGFDLGGTKMLAAVMDDSLKIITRLKKKTKAAEGVAATIDRLIDLIFEALTEASITPAQLGGIGIGAPGMLDLRKGIILSAPNLGWEKVSLSAIVSKRFNCPVWVINDVDAGIFGEYQLGAAKNARCALGIFPGTGIGGGCVFNGTIFSGTLRSCMEIGHMIMVPEGPLCGCGQRGCLEALSGRMAIAAAAVIAIARGEAPKLAQLAGTDIAAVRSGTLAESIAGGDIIIENIVRTSAQWVGKALASMVNVLAPDVIILGGGLVEAMPILYKKEISDTVEKYVLGAYKQQYTIALASLGDDAVSLGAASFARQSSQ